MRTKLLTMFATLAMLVCSLSASAQTNIVQIDGIWYGLMQTVPHANVVGSPNGGASYEGDVIIPSSVTYEGVEYGVVQIDEYAFTDCSRLTSITIPEGVTSIGSFYGCRNLTTINIPEGVTSIGSFARCSSLTTINIPEGVTSSGSFADCSSLTSINLPESLTVINAFAFENCTSLTSITLPKNVTRIEMYAFANCISLASINIPESVTEIEGPAFSGCSSLTTINIPENSQLTSFGWGAFENCSSLTAINIPEGVTSIGDSAFKGCSSLIAINLPEGVTGIEYETFKDCSSLQSVTFPENSKLTKIETRAFKGCSSLTSIDIPDGVTVIWDSAFENCSSLTSIDIPESVEIIRENAFYNTAWYNNKPDGVIYMGNWLYGYKGEMPRNTSIEVKDGTTRICTNAFYNYRNLVSIIIPESVTTIGIKAFYGCSGLTSVIMSEGVETIYGSAFYNCSKLASITIPESVTTIGGSAFCCCSSLTSVTIPKNVSTIGYQAFGHCYKLMEVSFESVVSPDFGDEAFIYIHDDAILNYPEGSDYSALRRYFSNLGRELIDGVVWIVEDDGTAYVYPGGSDVLKKYTGAKTLKKVYAYEFDGIGEYAFENSSIEEFYAISSYPGEWSINNGAFFGCWKLNKVCLPSSLTHIGDNAFYGCEDLRSFYLPEGLTYIGGGAFAKTGIDCLVIPESVMYIGEEQTEWDDNYRLWIFKNPYGLPAMESLPNDINYMVPQGASGYEGCGYLEKEYSPGISSYFVLNDKIFVFGGISETEFNDLKKSVMNSVHKVVVTPETGLDQNWNWFCWVQQLPSTVTLDVLKGGVDINYTNNPNLLYTIEGSNALFCGDSVLVAGYVNSVIPHGTKSILLSAFKSCSELKSIEIPNSVTYIRGEAFADCEGLTSIEIPSSVVEIASNAFTGCCDLDTIVVDEANPVYDSRDNCNAIIESQNNKLIVASKTTTIPSSVTSIGERAFSLCANMDVAVPDHVTCFDNYAFNNTKNLYFESPTPPTIGGDIFGWGAIFVPSDAYDTYCNADVWSQYKDRIVTKEMSEKEVEAWSTEGMSGILNAVGLNEADKVVKLKVKGEINSYDMIVMRDKMPLLQEIDLSEATVVASSKPFYQTYCTEKNSLGSYAFYDLDKLVSVKLPKGLTTLGDYAFYGCGRLKSVDASATEGLYMGKGTFSLCSDLQEFVAPLEISEIGVESFNGCNSLKELDINRIAGSIESNVFGGSGIEELNIDSIGGNVLSNAFKGCSSLKDFKVGTLVGYLGDGAFHGCSELKNVEFARGPQKVGSRVFTLADKLKSFVVGEGTVEISDKAFYAYEVVYKLDLWGQWRTEYVECDRPALKRVVLPESLQNIGTSAFSRCTALSDFSLSQNVTSIGASAFSGCTSLKSIEVPSTLTTLENRTFSGCSSLEEVTLPSGLATIGSGAFSGCSSLKEIILPHSLTTIASSTFSGCTSLENITFPDGLASIGDEAFSYCGIETLKLPPMLRIIDERAFSNCGSLKELHIPSSVEHIGGNAFDGCNQLNAVYTYTVEPIEITETTFSTFASATLHVPATSFWNYYWNIGWSRFNHKNFKDFNERYDYFYLNNDYYLNGSTGYIEGTPDADLRPGSGLVVEADKDNADGKQNLGDVSVGTDVNGNSASIIGDENLSIENLNVKINVKGGRWYFFAFPWDVALDKVSMQSGSDYVFRYYDGEERAKNGQGGWKDVSGSHLKAACGYIFQCSADDVLLISIEDVKFDRMDKFCELVTHSSHNLNDASWNLMGNPYLSYYDMAAMDYTAPVTVWDGEKYVAIRPGDDDYQFAPYEAFFVQKPEGEESVGFSADAQMTKTESTTLAAQQAKARRTRSIDPQRQLINLVLSYEETSDRTRVVFNNRQSHNYEVACDAAKFQSEGVAQIYTLDGEGVRYAINERPVGNGVVQIGYTAAENGYYTIEATRMDAEVYLYDAETKIMHSLDEGSYTFFSGKGTFEKRFTLGKQDGETTPVENIDIDAAVEVVEDGILLNTNATATVYNAAGMVVAVRQGAGFLQLPAGTYVVCIGENQSKVVVK